MRSARSERQLFASVGAPPVLPPASRPQDELAQSLLLSASMKTIAQFLGMKSPLNSEQLTVLLETCQCLSVVAQQLRDNGLSSQQVALQMRQYLACAAGNCRPELALDPVARRLLALSLRYQGGAGHAEWREGVRGALVALCRQRRVRQERRGLQEKFAATTPG